jgi:hypothetical protein
MQRHRCLVFSEYVTRVYRVGIYRVINYGLPVEYLAMECIHTKIAQCRLQNNILLHHADNISVFC